MSPATATTPAINPSLQATKPAAMTVLPTGSAVHLDASTASTASTLVATLPLGLGSSTVTPAVTPTATSAGHVAASSKRTSQPSPVALPRLRDGKSIPGPDEWRALERRALSFRLRGSDGSIGGASHG